MSFTNRKYGIELEICSTISGYDMADKLNAAGIQTHFEGYNHYARNHWKIVTDSSISPRSYEHHGYEIVSPPLSGETGLEQIKQLCKVLNENGAYVNRSCGFHVHVDGNDLDRATLIMLLNMYNKHESVIDNIMPSSRRGSSNRFCSGMTDIINQFSRFNENYNPSTINSFVNDLCPSRFYKLNLHAYLRHGTVEFRQHSGTTNANKINNWIQFCVNFVNNAKSLSNGLAETVATPVANASPRRGGFIDSLTHVVANVNEYDAFVLAIYACTNANNMFRCNPVTRYTISNTFNSYRIFFEQFFTHAGFDYNKIKSRLSVYRKRLVQDLNHVLGIDVRHTGFGTTALIKVLERASVISMDTIWYANPVNVTADGCTIGDRKIYFRQIRGRKVRTFSIHTINSEIRRSMHPTSGRGRGRPRRVPTTTNTVSIASLAMTIQHRKIAEVVNNQTEDALWNGLSDDVRSYFVERINEFVGA